MRITIIPDDKSVVIDGQSRMPLEFIINPQIHAVQWYDSWGEVEFKTQFVDNLITKPDNQIINSMDEFESAILAWQNWSPPEQETPEPRPVTQVTARQARLQLFKEGLLSQVESLVSAHGGEIQIEWEYATVIQRDSPLTQAIAHELELSHAQIQFMFEQAALR
jgi:hypothetical protein